jgi:hypothetical protein
MLFLKISLLKQFRANFYMCWLVTYIVIWCPCYSCCQHSIIYVELAQDVTICSRFVYQWGVWFFLTSCATWLFNPKLFSSFPTGFSQEMNGYYKLWNFLQIFHLLWFMGLGYHSYMLQPEQSEFMLEKLTYLVVCAFSTRLIYVALFHSVHVDTRFPP